MGSSQHRITRITNKREDKSTHICQEPTPIPLPMCAMIKNPYNNPGSRIGCGALTKFI